MSDHGPPQTYILHAIGIAILLSIAMVLALMKAWG